MEKNYSQININKKIINYTCEIDDKTLIKKLSTLTAKLLYVNYDKEQSLNILIDCVEDFIDLFGCFAISKNVDSLLWSLVKNSLKNATNQLLRSHDIHYKKQRISKDIKAILQDKSISTIDFNFIYKPANSDFSNFYCNRLCEWLSEFVSDKTITRIKNDWALYFTRAFTAEWCSNQEYSKILNEFNHPTRPYLEMMNELEKYTKNIISYRKQSIFDENVLLEDIYVEIKGIIKHPNKSLNEVKDISPYLFSWVTQTGENMCTISGDPGSGKSTIMKMLACNLAQSGHRVIFINLFQLNFSTKKPAIDVLNEYISKISWMKTYDLEKDMPVILMLDGLDEIKVDVWNTARELLREIKCSEWNQRHKIIISGRNKIIDFCEEEIMQFLKIQVLPLYIEPQEREKIQKEIKTNSNLAYDLRDFFWIKLQKSLSFKYDIDAIIKREHLKEISTSPLLLFLLSWTIKNSGEAIEEIRHSAELYEKILECIYTRKYNRKAIDYYTWKFDEYKKILSLIGVYAWQNNSRSLLIYEIEKFCKDIKATTLFEKWIDYHAQSNPSRLLLLFFFREKIQEDMPSESEIEFIHKSFYEYLSAVAIINFISLINNINHNELLKLVYFIFSRSLISVEIMEFIEGLLETTECKTISTYIDNIGFLLSEIFNSDWEILICNDSEKNIEIQNYPHLIECIKNVEENVIRLAEVFSNLQKRGNVEFDYRLKLTDCDFTSANMLWKDLSYSVFFNTDFSDAILSGGEFHNCNFCKIIFNKTIMNSCCFDESFFDNCCFSATHLECTKFSNSEIHNSKFESVISEGAYFTDAYLSKICFRETSFVAANFDDTEFEDIKFIDCDFERADFNGVKIKNTSWMNCSMKSAKFDNVRIAAFNLKDPEIVEMLSEADLTHAIFDDVPEEIIKKLIQ